VKLRKKPRTGSDGQTRHSVGTYIVCAPPPAPYGTIWRCTGPNDGTYNERAITDM
jgi:hypothetical protein